MFSPVEKRLYTNGSGILEDEKASICMNARWVIGQVWKWSGPSTEAAVYGSQCFWKANVGENALKLSCGGPVPAFEQ